MTDGTVNIAASSLPQASSDVLLATGAFLASGRLSTAETDVNTTTGATAYIGDGSSVTTTLVNATAPPRPARRAPAT